MDAERQAHRTLALAIVFGLAALGLAVTGALLGLRSGAGVRAARAALPPSAVLVDSSQVGLPARLRDTGLFAADGSIAPVNRPFSPQYPLWTDGAAKRRWIYLPPASRIDVSDVDDWRFPVGTKLWKEFAYGGFKVETRFFWLTETGWRFASYAWNAEQSEALLASAEGMTATVFAAPGKPAAIPSRQDCMSCHGATPAFVAGFSALQLADDRDPLAPHAEPLPVGALTLSALLADDRLAPARRELAERPPRIQATDATGRAAMGYLSTNCGVCHNGTGPLARLGFDLLHKVAGEGWAPEPALASGLEASTRYAVPGIAPDSTRFIAAGAPGRSALHYRMGSRRPASQMPPLGTVLVDSVAVALVGRWIVDLDADSALRNVVDLTHH